MLARLHKDNEGESGIAFVQIQLWHYEPSSRVR